MVLCQTSDSFVYNYYISGFAAGSHYTHTGGGVNYQCMPNTPEYNSWSNSGSYSILYGAEYESGNNGLFTRFVNDQNVPCARCLTPRSAVMMYPARRSCPSGWNKEYEGLFVYHYNH